MTLREDAINVLKETSRTFYIPIVRLPGELQDAVTSAYLCMRAIDEIEDHPELDGSTKADLLTTVSQALQTGRDGAEFEGSFALSGEYRDLLPEVTLRIADWSALAPAAIAPRVWDATAAMADRMAYWAANGWNVQTEADLDRYTFSVAGAVGLLLSDLWSWYDGTRTDRIHAIGFGRGLQAVNILRNHTEDLERGVDLYPTGWDQAQVLAYARRNLAQADQYVAVLPAGPVLDFCNIPLALAYATLEALARGEVKLDRAMVLQVLAQLENQAGDAREQTAGR
ncbi:MAG: squalene/phytoene synthase family protein [Chloroflexaceae bacterium]